MFTVKGFQMMRKERRFRCSLSLFTKIHKYISRGTRFEFTICLWTSENGYSCCFRMTGLNSLAFWAKYVPGNHEGKCSTINKRRVRLLTEDRLV